MCFCPRSTATMYVNTFLPNVDRSHPGLFVAKFTEDGKQGKLLGVIFCENSRKIAKAFWQLSMKIRW